MKIKPRKTIKDLKPYEPGKPIQELARQLKINDNTIIKLASNENPLGPSPKALRAMYDILDEVNRYPDGSCFYLKKTLASKLKLKPENLLFGNGSDEIIDIIAKTFLEESQEAIISKPSFLEYGIIVRTRGSRLKVIPLELDGSGFGYNLDKILKSVTKKTKLIFIGNPDNPTGAYFKKKDLDYFLKRCPSNILVVFDEAYRELVDKRDYSNPVSCINKGNVIVLRTFSKAYGLAGLRIGYCIACKDICKIMERTRQPFNVNIVAQMAAIEALKDTGHILKSKKLIRQGMEFLAKSLKVLGCEVIESPANFMLFSYKGIKGADIFMRLLPHGIIVRSMKAYGLDKWARVNSGTMKENKRFIEMLRKVLGEK